MRVRLNKRIQKLGAETAEAHWVNPFEVAASAALSKLSSADRAVMEKADYREVCESDPDLWNRFGDAFAAASVEMGWPRMYAAQLLF
jgi:hypothetical protein